MISLYTLIITGGFAWLTLVVRYCFISKCDSVKCCCLEIHRAVGAEAQNPEIQVAVSSPRAIQEQKSFSKI